MPINPLLARLLAQQAQGNPLTSSEYSPVAPQPTAPAPPATQQQAPITIAPPAEYAPTKNQGQATYVKFKFKEDDDGVPEAPPVDPNLGASSSHTDWTSDENKVDDSIRSLPFGMAKPVLPEVSAGANKIVFGDPTTGEDVFDDAYNKAPARYEAAAREEANQIGLRGQATADFYKRERQNQQEQLAQHQAERLRHQQILESKVAEYDAAAQKYSNDLADTGHFWKNPGNVVAAIGVALSNLAGKRDSAEVLNNMIVQDFNMRKSAADTRLGAMRSNIEQYRQIFGDKEAGDMYALSESFRVAAMEVQQIGAQFQGPIARANAEKTSAALRQQSDFGKMQAWQRALMLPDFRNKAIMDAYRKMGQNFPGKVQDYLNPGSQPLPGLPGPNPTGPGVMPSGGGQPASGVPMPSTPAAQAHMAIKAQNGGKATPFDRVADEELLKFLKLTPAEAADMNRRNPGIIQSMKNWKELAMRRAFGKTKQTAGQDEFRVKFNEIIDEDNKNTSEAMRTAVEQKAYQQRLWGNFHEDTARLKAAAAVFGKDPDTFLGWLRSDTMPSSLDNWLRKWDSRDVGGKLTPAEMSELEAAKAAVRFRQLVAGKVAEQNKSLAGASLTDNELKVLRQFITPESNYTQISNFAGIKSNEARQAIQDMERIYGVGPATLIRLRMGQGKSTRDTLEYRGYTPPKKKE